MKLKFDENNAQTIGIKAWGSKQEVKAFSDALSAIVNSIYCREEVLLGFDVKTIVYNEKNKEQVRNILQNYELYSLDNIPLHYLSDYQEYLAPVLLSGCIDMRSSLAVVSNEDIKGILFAGRNEKGYCFAISPFCKPGYDQDEVLILLYEIFRHLFSVEERQAERLVVAVNEDSTKGLIKSLYGKSVYRARAVELLIPREEEELVRAQIQKFTENLVTETENNTTEAEKLGQEEWLDGPALELFSLVYREFVNHNAAMRV